MVGLDSEFYGVDISTESPVARSRCHVFSVAVPSGRVTPRGHNEAESWVFAGELLEYPPVRTWLEDPGITKCCHNQPAEAHTFWNHGIELQGGLCTLEKARFFYPERATRGRFSLDALALDLVGVGKTEDFRELLGYEDTEQREVLAWKKRCECGELSCRKRSAGHQEKTPEEVMELKAYKVKRLISLTDLGPGHPRWERYLAYAAWDAVLALAVNQIMDRSGLTRPYLY